MKDLRRSRLAMWERPQRRESEVDWRLSGHWGPSHIQDTSQRSFMDWELDFYSDKEEAMGIRSVSFSSLPEFPG
jgi:hypothetical protein